jgi:hypothetical protein
MMNLTSAYDGIVESSSSEDEQPRLVGNQGKSHKKFPSLQKIKKVIS